MTKNNAFDGEISEGGRRKSPRGSSSPEFFHNLSFASIESPVNGRKAAREVAKKSPRSDSSNQRKPRSVNNDSVARLTRSSFSQTPKSSEKLKKNLQSKRKESEALEHTKMLNLDDQSNENSQAYLPKSKTVKETIVSKDVAVGVDESADCNTSSETSGNEKMFEEKSGLIQSHERDSPSTSENNVDVELHNNREIQQTHQRDDSESKQGIDMEVVLESRSVIDDENSNINSAKCTTLNGFHQNSSFKREHDDNDDSLQTLVLNSHQQEKVAHEHMSQEAGEATSRETHHGTNNSVVKHRGDESLSATINSKVENKERLDQADDLSMDRRSKRKSTPKHAVFEATLDSLATTDMVVKHTIELVDSIEANLVNTNLSEQQKSSLQKMLVGHEPLEPCQSTGMSINLARRKLLLNAIENSGAHMAGLRKILPDWTEIEILNEINLIRDERQTQNISWSGDEIDRLNGAVKAFGMRNIERILLAVGTRSAEQIASRLNTLIEEDTTKSLLTAEKTDDLSKVDEVRRTSAGIDCLDNTLLKDGMNPPQLVVADGFCSTSEQKRITKRLEQPDIKSTQLLSTTRQIFTGSQLGSSEVLQPAPTMEDSENPLEANTLADISSDMPEVDPFIVDSFASGIGSARPMQHFVEEEMTNVSLAVDDSLEARPTDGNARDHIVSGIFVSNSDNPHLIDESICFGQYLSKSDSVLDLQPNKKNKPTQKGKKDEIIRQLADKKKALLNTWNNELLKESTTQENKGRKRARSTRDEESTEGKSKITRWSSDEIIRLKMAVNRHGLDNYKALAEAVGNRDEKQVKRYILTQAKKNWTLQTVDKSVDPVTELEPVVSHELALDINNSAALTKDVSSLDPNCEPKLMTNNDEAVITSVSVLPPEEVLYPVTLSLLHVPEKQANECDTSKAQGLTQNFGTWDSDEIERLKKAISVHGRHDMDALEKAVGTRRKSQIEGVIRRNRHNVFDRRTESAEGDSEEQRIFKTRSETLEANTDNGVEANKSSKDQARANSKSASKKRKLPATEKPIREDLSTRKSPIRSTAKAASAKISMSILLDMDEQFDEDLVDNNPNKIKPTSIDKLEQRRARKKIKKTESEIVSNIESSGAVESDDHSNRHTIGPSKKCVKKKASKKSNDSKAIESYNGDICLESGDSQRLNDTSSVQEGDGDVGLESDATVQEDKVINGENEIPPDSVKIHVAKSDMPYFIEELAFHYFSQLSKLEKLEPLPEAFPLPEFPSDRWSFDENSRVLLVNFKNCPEIPLHEKRFAAQMMQRDDITLIFDGLLENLDARKWTIGSIEQAFCEKPYHKFRRFNREVDAAGMISYVEQDKFASMKVTDFVRYLLILQRYDESTSDRSLTYVDADGKEHTIEDVSQTIFYMIDVDMPKFLPTHDRDYKSSFKFPEILPGGSWCMMSSLPESARPFMGPNCYLTPGGGYTQFHQDGHGTVDSGHSNLCGFNEVIMLRRLPEHHKINACKKIPLLSGNRTEEDAFKTLYKLPHDDGREESFSWPTNETIEEWKTMNYYPSVFILKPGQHVHINKGRLHAFRKFTCSTLPTNDCHRALRTEVIENYQLKKSPLCLSVAFDWMYWGADKEGINREVASTVECAALCRDYSCKSLAIPETVILSSAMLACARLAARIEDSSMLSFETTKGDTPSCGPSESDLIAGILPSLRYLVKRDKSAAESNISEKNRDNLHKGIKLKKASKPDTFHDPLVYPIDPYGSDYFCMVCNQELSNAYFHCNGCEVILNRDFNICSRCYSEEKFLARIQIHPTSKKWYSDVNHVGNSESFCNPRRCPCHAGMCRTCPDVYCKSCSCQCHKVFTNQFRFIDQEASENLIKNCERIAYGSEVKFSLETEARLFRRSYMYIPKRTEKENTRII